MNGNSNDNPLILAFPQTPGYTLIPDLALQRHICEAWQLGANWQRWRMVSHIVAGAHDLLYAAGLAHRSPLLQDLEFLRQLAETRLAMERTASFHDNLRELAAQDPDAHLREAAP